MGIIIDTEAFELQLPADKLNRLLALLSSWCARKSCMKKELESLLGHLSPMQQRLYALAAPSSTSYLGPSPLYSSDGRSKGGLSMVEVLSSELEWVLFFLSS